MTRSGLIWGTVAKALGYTTMPRVVSRIGGFMPDTTMFAQLMVQVFLNVRLLPRSHLYVIRGHGLSYGVRDVMAAAASQLKGGWRHADQYIVYGVFLLGIAIFLLQFAVLFFLLLTQSAQAAVDFSIFKTNHPTGDIAFMMLDRVFQIPGFFNSSLAPATANDIAPFARGMQALFRFYSMGMLAIALFIVIYYIFVLVVESAQTGEPFGKRFPSVYGPIRLVLAILLLLPLAHGYNTGQYLTLLMARWGSSFATNGWIATNIQMRSANTQMSYVTMANAGFTGESLIAHPKIQEISHLINFFYLAHTCRAGYKIAYNVDIDPYFVVPATPRAASSSTLMTPSSTFPAAMQLFHGDMVIVFGEKNSRYTNYSGTVKPYCGQITIPIDYKGVNAARDIYDAYFKYIVSLWSNPDYRTYGTNMAYIVRFMDRKPAGLTLSNTSIPWDAPLSSTNAEPAGQQFYVDMRVNLQAQYNSDMEAAIVMAQSMNFNEARMTQKVMDMGWGGAGIWYNKLAELNGAVTDAVHSVPVATEYPKVMEVVAANKASTETAVSPKARFNASTLSASGSTTEKHLSGRGLDNPAVDIEMAYLMDYVYRRVADDQLTARPKPAPGSNDPIKTLFMFIYEQTGLAGIRDNFGVHPIAKLTMLGKSIIDKTIVSLGVGTMASGFGGLLSGAGAEQLGAAFEQGGGVLLGFASTGLIMGFVLYYLIPFFPFLYFFFAVGRWVKSIFEAMVAVPIWALGHLRLEGEGVGNAAAKGYFLLLEIFLRPILTLFGLLASFICFTAMIDVLDSIFDLVVMNVAGFDMSIVATNGGGGVSNDMVSSFRDSLDALFYTIFYTILVYMISMSSFKLIDLIPNKLMRYLQNVPSFHDGAGDPAENLVRNTAIAGHVLFKDLGGAVGGMAQGAGRSAGKMMNQEAIREKLGGP